MKDDVTVYFMGSGMLYFDWKYGACGRIVEKAA